MSYITNNLKVVFESAGYFSVATHILNEKRLSSRAETRNNSEP